MSKTTKEALKTPEKTPEEIAAELEKKASLLDVEGNQADAKRKRELAKKVREVESSTVTETTELKLEALQAKLPPLEKADLKEARMVSATEVAAGASGLTIAAVAINKQIDDSGLGHLGIKDSIKEWISEAITDEPGEDDGPFDKFIHKLKMMFLLPFAKVFGVDLTKKEDKEKKDSTTADLKVSVNTPSKIDLEKGILKASAYNHMTDHIFMRKNHRIFTGWWDSIGSGIADGSWNKDKRKAQEELNHSAEDILHSDFVRGKSFNQLKEYKGNVEKMDIANISSKKEQQAAKFALDALFDSENEAWIEENLKTKLPNWRDRPMFEAVSELYEGIGYERIERLKTGLQGVNWQSPGDIAGRMKTMMIQKNGDKYEGIVGENLESLRAQGLDNEAITRALDTDGSRSVKDYRTKMLVDSPYKNKDAQKFMTDLVAEEGFAKNMMNVLKEFGFGDYIKDFENGDSFNVRQLLMLYAITKGSTNLDAMKKGTRAELYMAIFGIILEKNPVAMPGKKLIEFVNSPTNKYVAEIGEFIGMQIDRATYEGMLVSMGLGADALNLMKDIQDKNPAIFYGVLTAITLAFVAAYYLRVPMVTATIAWGIITAGATAAGVSVLGSVK